MTLAALGYLLLAILGLGLAFYERAMRRGAAPFGLGRASARALEALGAGMVVLDFQGRVASCNAEAKFLLGLEAGPGRQQLVLAALRGVPELAALLPLGEGGASFVIGEGRGRRSIEARLFSLRRGGRTRILVLRDVSENAALLEELATLAAQDALTGIFNRRRLDELGERDIELSRRSGSSLGVLMLDIDFFKRVNDDHGHAVGDELLKAFCGACKEALRTSDILARYGGEEFAVLLPGSGVEESVMVAERLRAKIAGLVVGGEGSGVSVTVSVGVYAGVPGAGDSLGLFLGRADEAMYRAKVQGRNRVCRWEA
jgi:diguanylate cyclase